MGNAILDKATPAQRARATRLVRRAVKQGTLVKPPTCAWCGAGAGAIEAHHPDYARPLMVVWLCAPCHRQHHRTYATEHWLARHPS